MQSAFVPKSNYNFRLSNDQIEKIFQVFQMFDEDGDGIIKTEEIPRLLFTLGELTMGKQLIEFRSDFDPKDTGNCDISSFLVGMANLYRKQFKYDDINKTWGKTLAEDEEEIIRNALIVFFPHDSVVAPSVLEDNVSQRGDSLTREEFSIFLKFAPKNEDNEIELDRLADVLVSPLDH